VHAYQPRKVIPVQDLVNQKRVDQKNKEGLATRVMLTIGKGSVYKNSTSLPGGIF
jgi:hypothetical protein